MEKTNYEVKNLEKVILISLLTFFIFLTRGTHLLTAISLPDATFVLMFAGGMFLKDYKWLCYFLFISFGIDFFSPPTELGNTYLFNLGYIGLFISYFMSWFLGRGLNPLSIFSLKRFLWLGSIFIISSYLISTITFYYFSGWEIQGGATNFLAKYYQEFFIVNVAYLAILFVSIKFFQVLLKRKNVHGYE
ncbi:MAG: hypothetical protein HOF49_03630 [Nitrosomonadales bacterium]|jgi:hypothetical protein|nr:hypothetical protein [Nitrosomonadales bacterium]MBT3918665.1 hypothetical protein [Nitrosomonadales bacterium]MBT4183357.1 hypothetical protein [Nitrosomonadales bacterium]MBT4571465.1 hypothetical protein [Nitrosomonadales bacterium]MBT4759575.1 hypothetical protein [Nitrosomonadales bacterium]